MTIDIEKKKEIEIVIHKYEKFTYFPQFEKKSLTCLIQLLKKARKLKINNQILILFNSLFKKCSFQCMLV